MELGSYFLFLQEQIKDINISGERAEPWAVPVSMKIFAVVFSPTHICMETRL
jgi:hypothetical protein